MADLAEIIVVKEYRWATGAAVLGRRPIDETPRWVLSISDEKSQQILALNEREINRDAKRLRLEPGAVATLEADGLCRERGWSQMLERV